MIDERIFQQYDILNRIDGQVMKQCQCECPAGGPKDDAKIGRTDKKHSEPEVFGLGQ